eukprot:6214220-Pleurochrysis_carterae.AAC.3
MQYQWAKAYAAPAAGHVLENAPSPIIKELKLEQMRLGCEVVFARACLSSREPYSKMARWVGMRTRWRQAHNAHTCSNPIHLSAPHRMHHDHSPAAIHVVHDCAATQIRSKSSAPESEIWNPAPHFAQPNTRLHWGFRCDDLHCFQGGSKNLALVCEGIRAKISCRRSRMAYSEAAAAVAAAAASPVAASWSVVAFPHHAPRSWILGGYVALDPCIQPDAYVCPYLASARQASTTRPCCSGQRRRVCFGELSERVHRLRALEADLARYRRLGGLGRCIARRAETRVAVNAAALAPCVRGERTRRQLGRLRRQESRLALWKLAKAGRQPAEPAGDKAQLRGRELARANRLHAHS